VKRQQFAARANHQGIQAFVKIVIKITSQDDHDLTTAGFRNPVSCGNAKASWRFAKWPPAKRRIYEEVDSAPITR
jgi:hypothetical protein